MDSHSVFDRNDVLASPVNPAQIRALIARMDSVMDLDRLHDNTPFADAGADSLDFFNIISQVQMVTGITIPDEDLEQVATLNGLVSYLNTRLS